MPSDHDDLHAVLEAVGGFATATPDPRVDLPLPEQVRRLIEWACSTRPDAFTRSVPVRATDHDELITLALGKLAAGWRAERERAERAEQQLAAAHEFIAAHDALEELILDFTDDRAAYNAAAERLRSARAVVAVIGAAHEHSDALLDVSTTQEDETDG